MKKAILSLILLIFATTTYAACDITDTINKTSPKNYTIDDKDYSITLSSLSNSSGEWLAKFKVNGVLTSELEETQKHTFNDLSEIKIVSIVSSSEVQICFTGGLTGFGQGTCSSNEDCNDNNPCTIDECDGDPLRCHRTLILWCKNDDGCCYESKCTAENDNDCGKPLLIECINDSQCNDNNTLTVDICDNSTKRCSNTPITECISNDTLCPANCTFVSDTDCDECATNGDCDDDNACTIDTCSGIPTRCSNNATSGCDLNGVCVSIGTRTENQFCNKNNIMESLRSKKEYCDDDYECISNICKKNKCKNPFFLKKIFSWFSNLF